MRIQESFSELLTAAQALYCFLSVYPNSRAYVFVSPAGSRFLVIDYRSFREQMATLNLQYRTPIFFGSLSDLITIAQAVPPSIFANHPISPETQTLNQED